jgi:beta-galactosidase
MSHVFLFRGLKNACAILIVSVSLVGHALAADVVTTHKDDNGWKLKVNGKDFYVKGVVWGYTPRDENYNYNLWGESDDFVRKVLDYEFGLLKAAGVTAIRSFNIMPPKWVTYVYREYGIMTVINPLMGRYGYLVDGKWAEFTDYSDPRTREVIKRDTLAIVNTYKNVDGVLMFAFGNESNYGLSWKSFEIEDLPVGEQYVAKARYLYSLFQETMQEGKAIDSNHPFTFINGDLQYIDLIVEINTDLDLLGVNAYRGKSFTTLWEEVDAKLDVPVLFFEFGSDAFNARTFEEDQVSQAQILKDQWREMYNKSYGNDEEGNAIGGFVFEWRDEWWKYLQVERLDIHDTNASWANGGYPHDFVDGKNNMNEEWWGIAALGTVNSDGIYEARTRMAYDMLSEIWSMDPYTYKKVAFNEGFDNLSMELYALKAEVRELRAERKEDKKILGFTGGSISMEFAFKGDESQIDEFGDSGDEFSDGEMIFMDFGFAPTNEIEGQFTINVLGDVAELGPMEIAYGRRGLPLTVQTVEDIEGFEDIEFTRSLEGRERVEIYDFSTTYQGEAVDIDMFYHTPRFHWKYEGDFFGLINEATDLAGEDIWNSKAPKGVEFASKGATETEGLKLVIGPEIYWGANPKAVLKWQSKLGKTMPFLGQGWLGQTEFAVMLSEDFGVQDESVGATAATVSESRAATLYTKTSFTDAFSLELGTIISSTEKRGDIYDRIDKSTGNIVLDTIDSSDTLGFKARLNFPLFGSLAYVSTHQAGLVADGGDPLREFGTRLPYSGLGNKSLFEVGSLIPVGNWWFFPRYLERKNLVSANPFIAPEISDGTLNPGISPRNLDADPFAVLDNREAKAGELFITYDPTGATPFYQWDNDTREDAGFAFNVGANYTEYGSATDSYQFFFEPTDTNAAFGVGLPSEDVWELSSRMVFNPNTRMRLITNVTRGFLQSTGDPDGGTRKFWEAEGKFVYKDRHIFSGYFKKDAWGAYDFQRQFNITFPEQYKLDYNYLLDQKKSETNSSQIGIRGLWRTLDDNSGFDEFLTKDNDYQFQVVMYYIFNFGGTNPPKPRN